MGKWKDARASVVVMRTARVTAMLLLSLTMSATAFAHSRRHVLPLPQLFPTAGSLEAQNAEADRLRLPRIQNADELRELVQDGELVPFHTTGVRTALKGDHATLRPWAADMLAYIAQQSYIESHITLTVSSAVRTQREQKRLHRRNRNAAPVSGPTASVHPTGIAFDIAKRTLTRAQRQWLQWRLFYLQARGQVIVEEEFRQSCFHIVVLQQ